MFEHKFNQGDCSCKNHPTDQNLQQPSFIKNLTVRDEIKEVVKQILSNK